MEPLELPIACSLTAEGQGERAAEFRQLMRRALAERRREPGRVVLSFRAAPGVAEQVEDLAARERECCPFLEIGVEHDGEGVVELSLAGSREAQPVLDGFCELAAEGAQPDR